MLHRFGDPAFRDLMEHDAKDLRILLFHFLGQVPGDRFSFAVGVGGQIDCIRPARMRVETRNHLGFPRNSLIFGDEPALHVNA